MFEILQEADIVHILREGKNDGVLYQIKEIKPDKNDECGQWWSIKFQVINIPVVFTWTLDQNQIAQSGFTMNGVQLQVILYARAMVGKVEKKSSEPTEIKSLF
jgi:hypothetical protein